MMSESEARLTEELRLAHLEIKLLKQKLDVLARRLFGRSSEKLDAAQMQLLFEGLEEIAAVAGRPDNAAPPDPPKVKTPAERAPRGPRLPEHLPVREIILDPEAVQACPEDWIRIGEEVSEQLDYTPASFVRLRLVRRKYVRKDRRDLPPVIAPLPPGLQERCLAAPSLLAHCMVSHTAIICLGTGWSKFMQDWACRFPARPFATGAAWPPMPCRWWSKLWVRMFFQAAMCRLTRRPSSISPPATGRPKPDICGWPTTRH
jgi:hypothetical protein